MYKIDNFITCESQAFDCHVQTKIYKLKAKNNCVHLAFVVCVSSLDNAM